MSTIAIVSIVRSIDQMRKYDIAMETVKCYSKIHGYHYILAEEKHFDCHHNDRFFRRHCIVARILPHFSALLFLDADMGVVYPKRKIEEFLDENFDVTFYDRFYNWEIMAGTYLVRNTPYAIKFLNDFADYESTLPNSFHGTDNGALHFFLAERFLSADRISIDLCRRVYEKSRNWQDVFTYEACLRSIFGSRHELGRVRILGKIEGWARDSWLTNNVWNKEIGDFMFHSWKNSQIRKLTSRPRIKKSSMYEWVNPLAGGIDLDLCNSKNMTWSYDERLIGDEFELREHLQQMQAKIVKEQFISLSRIRKFI
ncbi:unnamed protein product [Caenorhabditis bovis]|uniref:Nucleotide-diphospho-sugar transferase domain-containing protein n=1 Tax=Caenorhabditis bovis TaxID=2654633 RepID=A0A8S1EGN4_9PELO|nr:unnamed protein product [Caenorhabditis bovis]